MTPQNALKKAIENGYPEERLTSLHCVHEMVLDPVFWEKFALSQMGWSDVAVGGQHPIYWWKLHQVSMIDEYLMKGKTIEDFFKERTV